MHELVATCAHRSRSCPHGRVEDAPLSARIAEMIAEGTSVIELYMDEQQAIAWRAALVDVDEQALGVVRERWHSTAVAGFARWDSTGNVEPMCLHAAITFPELSDIVDGVLTRLPLVDFQRTENWFAGRAVAAARTLAELRTTLAIVPAVQAAVGIDPWTIIARHGEAALPVLEELFLRASEGFTLRTYHPFSATNLVSFMSMLSVLSSSSKVLKVLIACGELRALRPSLERAMQHQPRALLHTALLYGATRPGLARDIAGVVVRRDPALLDVATTELQRATLASLLAEGVAIAPRSSLPPELQKAPWVGKQPRAVVIDGLVPSPLAPQLVWRPGQREAWGRMPARPNASTAAHYVCGVDEQGTLEAAIAFHAARGPNAPALSNDEHPLLSLLPESLLRGMWATYPVTAWHLDTISARRLVARLGLDVVDGMLARAGLQDVAHVHVAAGLEPRRTRLVVQSMDALQPVASLQVVPLAVAAMGYRDARRLALAWIDAHPDVAAAGLLPLALGSSAARNNARVAVQALAQRHRAVVEAAASGFSPAVVDAVQALLAENPLALAKAPRRASWVSVRELPAVHTTHGERLDDDAVGLLVDALSVGALGEPYAGLEAMTATLVPASVSALAWGLFRQWWLVGAPNADAWVLAALGNVGDELVAAALVEQMAAWVEEGLTARAKTCIQVLTTMASRVDEALLALFRFSKRAPAKSLARAATDAIDAIAAARGLSIEELADRLVPDLGLASDGTIELPLGDRTLIVTFDGLLTPLLADREGRRLPSLPRLSSSMDAALHAEAKVKLKQLTKAAADVGKHMLRRLEGALAEQRRWPRDVAVVSLLRHPLLQLVARRLVWTDLDDNNTQLAAFRVAEDGTFADIDDNTYALRGTSVGLLHPLHASTSALAQWRERFADYELHQPFAQLEREVFDVAGADDEADDGAVLRRFVDVNVPTGRLFSLEARGWQRGAGTATRRVDGVEARLHYAPGIFGGPDASRAPQTLGLVELLGGHTWRGLAPLVRSELLHDLERLRRQTGA